MEKDNDMNVKIMNAGLNGERNNGSCRKLAEYLGHEDTDRIDAGKKPLPFTTPDGLEVSKEEVIEKIDRNHCHLSKKDDKFFGIVIAPSRNEIMAMGSNERDIYRAGKKLAKAISDAYAENFNHPGIVDRSDLVLYWKPHFTRGDNGDLQFHIHGIVSRKSRPGYDGKSVKLSPMTNHKDTKDGPVKGGFNRNAFYSKCERIFDNLFNYERSVTETFEYNNTMAHGTPEEKAAQTERLAEEQGDNIENAVKAGIARRRKNLKDKAEVEEIALALSQAPPNVPPSGKDPVVDAFDQADRTVTILHIFEVSSSKDVLDQNLLAAGMTMSVVTGKNGGVTEIVFIHKGRKLTASDIMGSPDYQRLLTRWEAISGQAPESKINAKLEADRAEKESKKLSKQVSQVNPPKKKIGRGM